MTDNDAALQTEACKLRCYAEVLHETIKGLTARVTGRLEASADHRILCENLELVANHVLEQSNRKLQVNIDAAKWNVTSLQQGLDDVRETMAAAVAVEARKHEQMQEIRRATILQRQLELQARHAEQQTARCRFDSRFLETEAHNLEAALVRQAMCLEARKAALWKEHSRALHAAHSKALAQRRQREDEIDAERQQRCTALQMARAGTRQVQARAETSLTNHKAAMARVAAASARSEKEIKESSAKAATLQQECGAIRQEIHDLQCLECGEHAEADIAPSTLALAAFACRPLLEARPLSHERRINPATPARHRATQQRLHNKQGALQTSHSAASGVGKATQTKRTTTLARGEPSLWSAT
mmetsp:Transcript_48044/g.79579  ORF Transcript_48044/g.79579 Transcript_48044/m.79579 type:complete len:359 (-) Transcript_48044:332-1408(-)|eukprot:CAMPEP_0119302658 /NCGR_PEP_ID=MMETSP1333-20130426/4217_1 /TAXON_ID=418940 /ORGANISM="Scyphosphaera apsteinii, Strain RCC1455" /LENGTH=358 /DNA_ID=CAMNT_0007305077 /DNA_START=165 /DNA_END=1241 /DNA_ORIENTATION=-